VRSRVEHVFHVLKRIFGFAKVRYGEAREKRASFGRKLRAFESVLESKTLAATVARPKWIKRLDKAPKRRTTSMDSYQNAPIVAVPRLRSG
jgi:hypothetical protein